ncbi:GNAT family N-acetyltransferase [Streptomyces sp. CBMA123]|uniref:GNAT family N-acetyltransferase n=1 Tax=Streptomyces sp. CBMA123 TaxID=1896313 RepID=UPI0039830F0A
MSAESRYTCTGSKSPYGTYAGISASATHASASTSTDTRTFALCEVMVRKRWRGTGVARTLHEELLSHRIEDRSHLLVEEDHPKVRVLYERWGYTRMGTMQPYPDSPRYDSMLRPIA